MCQTLLAATVLGVGAGSVHDATALNETRTLTFHHTHSDENLTVTFKRDGRYDEEALKKLNHFLRDWRTQEATVMDRRLFDIIWEVYREVDGKKPIQIISSYRSPATNAMLRRRSAGVARHSQHMLGHAMDFYIPDVPLEQIRYAGLRLQRGGVGFYPTSGSPFVHLDTGSIRHWPRMSRDQLARVFPDGKTVHVPTDGVPLKGYELARAEIDKRGNGDEAVVASKPSFLASLFKGRSSNDEDDEASEARAPAPAAAASKPQPLDTRTAETKTAEAVPTPRARPQIVSALQLASADAQVAQQPLLAKPRPATQERADARPQNPADIINSRGFWDEITAPKQATPAQVAAINARRGSEPEATASVPAAYQAMAYAPPPAPGERTGVVTASAPIPPTVRPRSAAAPVEINSVAAKGVQGKTGVITTSTRIAAAKFNEIWTRMLLLAPSVTTSMSVTRFGDTDLTAMRAFFTKPKSTIAMGFSEDPLMGLTCDRFSGSATARLETMSLRTASLR